ncbi:hypothetical protein CIG19_08915 [Enterobacterales bacterium CwR94]|nr:hypothetical protein CIG19_08915 [Enterobacterales bacterium CwR94]
MFRRMQDDINTAFFNEYNRIEQNRLMQYLYNLGYNVPAIARKFALSPQSVYSRIDAHRGRGPAFT